MPAGTEHTSIIQTEIHEFSYGSASHAVTVATVLATSECARNHLEGNTNKIHVRETLSRCC